MYACTWQQHNYVTLLICIYTNCTYIINHTTNICINALMSVIWTWLYRAICRRYFCSKK